MKYSILKGSGVHFVVVDFVLSCVHLIFGNFGVCISVVLSCCSGKPFSWSSATIG